MARGKEPAGGEKEEPPKIFTLKCLEESFADLSEAQRSSFKKFENTDPNTKRFSLIQRNVYGALSAHKQI